MAVRLWSSVFMSDLISTEISSIKSIKLRTFHLTRHQTHLPALKSFSITSEGLAPTVGPIDAAFMHSRLISWNLVSESFVNRNAIQSNFSSSRDFGAIAGARNAARRFCERRDDKSAFIRERGHDWNASFNPLRREGDCSTSNNHDAGSNRTVYIHKKNGRLDSPRCEQMRFKLFHFFYYYFFFTKSFHCWSRFNLSRALFWNWNVAETTRRRAMIGLLIAARGVRFITIAIAFYFLRERWKSQQCATVF